MSADPVAVAESAADPEHSAAEAMYAALRNTPCSCVYQYPYAPRGEVRAQCARCRSMRQWETMRAGEEAAR